jgi:hypothetical protein
MRSELWANVHAERAELVDDLTRQPDLDWTTPSLCVLFHDADLATLRAALPTVARCDLSAVYGESPTEDPARVPSTYLLPAHDRTPSRASMERFARERLGVEFVVIDGAHNCYFAHADKVAEVIMKATRP